jgi:hypothetical protein
MCLGLCIGANSPVIQPNPKALHLAKVLFVLVWCQVALAILYFSSVVFITDGIFQLLMAVLLYNTHKTYRHSYLIIYIFIQILNLITSISYVGGLLQHKLLFRTKRLPIIGVSTRMAVYSEIVCIMGIGIIIVFIVYSVRAYKEFKASYMEQYMNKHYDSEQAQEQPRRNNNYNHNAFKGRGVVIG